MQPLLDGPRASLSEDAVRALLQSHSALEVGYGADGLDSTFSVVADLSAYMSSGGQIISDDTATIPRTCNLNMDAGVTDTGWSYLSGYVRPNMTLTDVATGVSATFHLGVYALTTPTKVLGSNPPALEFQGYDLVYLLQQPIGDSYEVAAGSDPAQAAADAISAAIPSITVDVVPSGTTLSQPLSWPFDATTDTPTTYLDVVQTLLAAVGYHEVWVDWDGTFHVEPYVDLQELPFEWTFDVGADDNIVADGTQQEVDIFDVPNWWRFIMADLTDLPVEGVSQYTYEDASPSNPGSTVNRGRTVRSIEQVTSTSYDQLVAYAQRKIAADLTPGETFSVTTQPFPLAWRLDIIRYVDPELDTSQRRVVATGWTLPLDGMSDMQWAWQTVTDATAALGVATSTEDANEEVG